MNKKQKIIRFVSIVVFSLIAYGALFGFRQMSKVTIMCIVFVLIACGLLETFNDKKQKKDEQEE